MSYRYTRSSVVEHRIPPYRVEHDERERGGFCTQNRFRSNGLAADYFTIHTTADRRFLWTFSS